MGYAASSEVLYLLHKRFFWGLSDGLVSGFPGARPENYKRSGTILLYKEKTTF